MFTTEQLKGFARWVLTLVGGLVAGWFASKGWFTVDQVTSIFTSETAIGIVVAGLSLLWNMVAKTKIGIVSAAQALPDVQVASSDKDVVAAVPGVTTASAASINK